MAKLFYVVLGVLMLSHSTQAQGKKPSTEQSKREILEAEARFAEMAKDKGIHQAFMAFAAEDAVLSRNNELVKGKKAIDQFYQNQDAKGLAWTAEFVDVSAAGDLGYTYGHYTFSQMDKDGKMTQNTGIFHTVWKRQADGNWKFVWD